MNGVFSSLSKYAFCQEENFLTESLVYLLNLILEREREIGLEILAICVRTGPISDSKMRQIYQSPRSLVSKKVAPLLLLRLGERVFD